MVVSVRSAPLSVNSGAPERRRSSRHAVTLGGKLFYGLAGLSIDCVIRDLSDHGARIAVPKASWRAPKAIRLLSLREGRIYIGEVMWNRGRYLGLDFSRVVRAADATDPDLAPIRAIWLAQG